MINYGKISPKVVLLDKLPNINTNPVLPFFDVSALAIRVEALRKTNPTCLDLVVGKDDTFAFAFPSKRPFMVNNFLNASGNTTALSGSPSILWTPVSSGMPVSGSLSGTSGGLIANATAYPSYTLEQPNNYITYSSGYAGPQWLQTSIPYIPPSDSSDNKNLYEALSGAGISYTSGKSFSWDTSGTNFAGGAKAVYQTVSKSGVWWGIESSSFLTNDMAFSVNFIIHHPPNASNGASPFLMISLGPGSSTSADRIDCIIPFNHKPKIIDYANSSLHEWEDSGATISDSVKDIKVSFMTAAGKLITSINEHDYVYTRMMGTSGDFSVEPIIIKEGPIRIYGGSIAATIYAAPLAFSPGAIFYHDCPSGHVYKNCNASGRAGSGAVCLLPKAPSDNGVALLYGVDCSQFTGIDNIPTTVGSVGGFGFHGQGICKHIIVPSAVMKNSAAVFLSPTYCYTKDDAVSAYGFRGGCPYFYKIKGVATATPSTEVIPVETDITNFVMSVSEDISAPDFFHVKRSATVTCVSSLSGQLSGITGQAGIRISWTGSGDSQPYFSNSGQGNFGNYAASGVRTFTGLVNSFNTSHSPGKTTTTLQCEDYVYILSSTFMLNSPIYDGMIMAYAIQDVAARGGVVNSVIDWTSGDMYYNKAGYSFSSPALKFSDRSSLWENMMQLVKGDSAYIYFDSNGILHIAKIPGGLMGCTTASIDTKFQTNPSGNLITVLGENTWSTDYTSTVNRISLLTLDRVNRDPIIESHSATGAANKLLFNKVYLYDEAAIGGVLEARARVRELGELMFRGIKKQSFTVPFTSGSIIHPLQYIEVDNKQYRVMSIKRTYNAENNESLQVIEGTTLGATTGAVTGP